MYNFDYTTKEDIKNIMYIGHKFLAIHTILIARGSRSGKSDAPFNLIGNQPEIDKIIIC